MGRRASRFRSLVGRRGSRKPPIRVGPSSGTSPTRTRRLFDNSHCVLFFFSSKQLATPPSLDAHLTHNTHAPSSPIVPPSFSSHSPFPLPPPHPLLPVLLSIHPSTLLPSIPSQPHMCKKRRCQLVHPPFPSISWVMTAQANPPSPTYAFGYVQNARAQSGKSARLPGRSAVPPARPHLPRWPRSPVPPAPPTPAPSPTRANAATVPAEHDETFMVNPSLSTFGSNPLFFFSGTN